MDYAYMVCFCYSFKDLLGEQIHSNRKKTSIHFCLDFHTSYLSIKMINSNGLYFCRDCSDALNHGLATSCTHSISLAAAEVHFAISSSINKLLICLSIAL